MERPAELPRTVLTAEPLGLAWGPMAYGLGRQRHRAVTLAGWASRERHRPAGAARERAIPEREPDPRRRRRAALAADRPASLCACVALWWFSVSWIRVGTLDDYGLLPVFPLSFFAALALLVASFVAAVRSRPSEVVLAGHALALIVFLHGTMPLLFSEPFYPWVYKHVGVVEYIDLHGRLDASVDIYQNWPAFFALSAWFGRVAGARPLEYVAWAQVFFNACNLVLLRYVFGSLSRDLRLIWIAVFVFFSANWVAQDYSRPRRSLTLSLGLCGVILRWLLIAPDRAWMARWLNRVAAFIARLGRRRRSGAGPEDEPAGSQRVGRRTARTIAIALFAVIVTTTSSPLHAHRRSRRAHLPRVVRPACWWSCSPPWPSPTCCRAWTSSSGTTGCWGRPGSRSRMSAPPPSVPTGWPASRAGSCRPMPHACSASPSGAGPRRGGPPAPRRLQEPGRRRPGGRACRHRPRRDLRRRGDLPRLPVLAALVRAARRLRAATGRRRLVIGEAAARLLLPLALLLGLFLPAYFGMAATNEVRPGEVAASQYFYDHAPPIPC